MNRHVTFAIIVFLGSRALARADAGAALVFGMDKVWTFHLTISATNWDAMHPSRGQFMMPPAPPGKVAKKDTPVPARGGFGFDFDYVTGTLECDGRKLPNVAVRFKGNSSYLMSARGLKRPFRIDLDRYTPSQNFHGLKKLNLCNNALDPSQLRESLAFSVFRAAGVPAPRTAFVELYVTVPAKHDREFAGLYTLIECVDKTFLKEQFPKSAGKGMLLKPEGIQGLPYLGTEWKPYADRYRPKDEPGTQEQRRLREFTRLVNFAADAEFNRSIDRFMDVDRFLRYLAACSLLVNLDSFVGFGHNYYMYLNPSDSRFVWIPWDLNHSFGGLSMGGSNEDQAEWAVKRPYVGDNRLTGRLLAVPAYEAAYRKHLAGLAASGFNPAKLHADIDRMQQAVQALKEREAKNAKDTAAGGFGLLIKMFGQPPELKKFISRRAESVSAQLAGKSEGKALTGFGGPVRPGLGSQFAQPIRNFADADNDGKLSREEAAAALKQFFNSCAKPSQAALNEKALTDGIAKLRRPSSFWGNLLSSPAPLGFGTGVHLAGLIFTKAGVKDDQLTADTLLALGAKLFDEADKDKDGLLDEKELVDGLNALPAPTPVFSPPAAQAAKKQEAGSKR